MSDVPFESATLQPTNLDPGSLAHCPHCHTGRLVMARVALHPAREGMAMHVNLVDGQGFEFPTDTPHEGMPVIDLYLQCLDCEQWAARPPRQRHGWHTISVRADGGPLRGCDLTP